MDVTLSVCSSSWGGGQDSLHGLQSQSLSLQSPINHLPSPCKSHQSKAARLNDLLFFYSQLKNSPQSISFRSEWLFNNMDTWQSFSFRKVFQPEKSSF